MIPFVTHSKCPNNSSWTPTHIKKVDHWYGNLQAKTHHNMKAHYNKRKDPSSITLWMAWQATQAQWNQFMEKFMVSGALLTFHALSFLGLSPPSLDPPTL